MTTNSESSTTKASAAKDATRQEADQLKDSAQSAAGDVAETAKDEAYAVKDEARDQAQSLIDNVQDEVNAQASTQQQRLAEQSRTVTNDLQRISRGEQPESDMVTRAVSSVTQQAENFTRQLETKEPRELLDDVRRFAARRPGTFLMLAAGAGLVAGRLTRGLRDADSSRGNGQPRTRGMRAPDPARNPAAYDPTAPVRNTTAHTSQPDIGPGGGL